MLCPKIALAFAIATGLITNASGQTRKAAAGTKIATGPAVGEKIPDFEAVDQNGKRQTFDSLKGPNGLLLMFHRSADW